MADSGEARAPAPQSGEQFHQQVPPQKEQQPSQRSSILRRTSSQKPRAEPPASNSDERNNEKSGRITWEGGGTSAGPGSAGPAGQSASYRSIPEVRQKALHERRRRLSDGSSGRLSVGSGGGDSAGGDSAGAGGSSVDAGSKKRRRSSGFFSVGGASRGTNRRSSVGEVSGTGSGSGGGTGGGVLYDDKKTRAVFCLRVVTILTLVAAAVTTATLAYVYVSRDEESNFSTQYQDSVVKVADAFQQGLDVKTSSSSTFSAMYTSRYGPQDTWPNVTMPNFSEQASGQLDLCEGRALSFNPIITNETKAGWESFANASKEILGADPDKIQHVENGIFGRNPPAAGSRYPEVDVPVWQIAPIESNERAVMFNLHSEKDRMRALDDVIEYKVPALTAMLQLVQDTDLRPSSILFYPVFDHFATADDPDSHEVVGTISIVFSWDVVLASVLPAYIKGMICVIETTNGEVFTWSITGDTATLLGEGDLHDPKYERQNYTVEADLEGTAERLGNVDFLITYKLTMYPSDEMRSQYITNTPAVYTTVIVLIFVCTAAIFLLYDYLVEHRQNKIMRAAARSTNIVEQMFPAAFRERMFRDAKKEEEMRRAEEQQIRKASRDHRGSVKNRLTHLSEYVNPTHQMKQFLVPKSKAQPDFNVPEAIATGGSASEPIADLFPDTSIMFCDIVGFTAWCAGHEPNHVFHLLETLYWEFDEVAKLYNVFKLGTIGDCYIAATGLPDPQEDHATLLAEFSEECRRKMHEAMLSLENQPGMEGSAKLSMRFGIHSGPITAGVLRGQKSRFELFGDTINVASRMESTGHPNRIQVSEETARLLREDGYADWLVPRKGFVRAKGKGELKTYWLNVTLIGDGDYPEVGLNQEGDDEDDDGHVVNDTYYYNREDSALSSSTVEIDVADKAREHSRKKTTATEGGAPHDSLSSSDIETGNP